jgi:tetratricopeptide (TPR) repeat protein
MILAFAAAIAAAQPAPPVAAGEEGVVCGQAMSYDDQVCAAIQAGKSWNYKESAQAYERAAEHVAPGSPNRARAYAAAGNMWIAAGEPGKAAFALDRALAGTGLQSEQRGQALLDRARAAEAQNHLQTARAKVGEAAATISGDPFLWYFSAALAIREGDAATAKASIGKALTLAPDDPVILFEAGHVAHLAGDIAGARDYWTRASAADPKGDAGKVAREALAMLDQSAAVQPQATPAK